MIDGWSPRIGDPGTLGWVTVAAYLLAAVACFRAAWLEPSRARTFWWALATVMVALGINKQLDLQSLLTAVARQAARTQGWFAYRHDAQVAFMVIAIIAGLMLTGWLARSLRDQGRPARLAGLGCVALIIFVLIRAASFHHVEALLMTGAGGVRINHCLELGGIALIGSAALMARRGAAAKG